MKGLEISEVALSALERTWRLDAEFYAKEYLATEALLARNSGEPLTDSVKVSDGNHMGISDEFQEEGVPYYRGGEVKSFFLEMTKPLHRVSEEVFYRPVMRRSHLRKGDVLVTIVGTIGSVSTVVTDQKAICSCKIAILRPFDTRMSAYIGTYLRTRYGQSQVNRLTRGSVQMGFVLDDFGLLLVPQFSDSFYRRITQLVDKAHDCELAAIVCMDEASQLLLSELGFASWTPTEESVSVKNCSDFVSAGRFDAEYFQPKYDELFALLAKCKVRSLGGKDGLVDVKRSIEPGSDAYSDKGIPFVRIADFTELGITLPEIHVPPELCADSPRPKRDTILLSKDGSVGIAYKVEEDLDVITSSGILHLSVKDGSVLPDYLTLVLNSKIVRLQAERSAGGSIIQHWKQSEIENVSIPLLPMSSQQKIAAKVRESFALRAESKRLLEKAKQAVELAIERGEPKSMELMYKEESHGYD